MEMNFDAIGKILGIVVLVVVLLFVLTWAGIVKCGTIPYWCEAYETVMGAPRVLIVYGESGMGDPDALKLILLNPTGVNAKAVDTLSIDRVSLGNLRQYKLVIVEKARKISAQQLDMFMQYHQTGGRLVWVGDAGIEKGSDEVSNLSDVNELAAMGKNPWARAIDEGINGYTTVPFDERLGLSYQGQYCEMTSCPDAPFSLGLLKPEPTASHPLIFRLSAALNMKISKEHDLAVVKVAPNASNTNIVYSVDLGSVVNTNDGKKIGPNLPIIVTSGLGERLAYYAYPVEYFYYDSNYFNIAKNMYQGMLGK